MLVSNKTFFIIMAAVAVPGGVIIGSLPDAEIASTESEASKPAAVAVRPAAPNSEQISLNASNNRKGKVRRACHSAFKASMYDPSSFRVVDERFNALPDDDGTGHIAYIADVSGTNGFGGRIIKNIACIADGSVITDYQF